MRRENGGPASITFENKILAVDKDERQRLNGGDVIDRVKNNEINRLAVNRRQLKNKGNDRCQISQVVIGGESEE